MHVLYSSRRPQFESLVSENCQRLHGASLLLRLHRLLRGSSVVFLLCVGVRVRLLLRSFLVRRFR